MEELKRGHMLEVHYAPHEWDKFVSLQRKGSEPHELASRINALLGKLEPHGFDEEGTASARIHEDGFRQLRELHRKLSEAAPDAPLVTKRFYRVLSVTPKEQERIFKDGMASGGMHEFMTGQNEFLKKARQGVPKGALMEEWEEHYLGFLQEFVDSGLDPRLKGLDVRKLEHSHKLFVDMHSDVAPVSSLMKKDSQLAQDFVRKYGLPEKAGDGGIFYRFLNSFSREREVPYHEGGAGDQIPVGKRLMKFVVELPIHHVDVTHAEADKHTVMVARPTSAEDTEKEAVTLRPLIDPRYITGAHELETEWQIPDGSFVKDQKSAAAIIGARDVEKRFVPNPHFKGRKLL